MQGMRLMTDGRLYTELGSNTLRHTHLIPGSLQEMELAATAVMHFDVYFKAVTSGLQMETKDRQVNPGKK